MIPAQAVGLHVRYCCSVLRQFGMCDASIKLPDVKFYYNSFGSFRVVVWRVS
jgi:hypothetical protein